MKTKYSKGLIVLLSIYFGFFLLDLGTTLMNGSIIHHLESNPLYIVFESFIPVILMNFILLGLLYYHYRKPSVDKRFFLFNLISWLTLARLAAIRNAIAIYNNPPPVEVAAAISTTAKVAAYSDLMVFVVFVPILVTQIAYYLFKIDHKIVIKS